MEFDTESAAKTALLLTNALIVDRPITVTQYPSKTITLKSQNQQNYFTVNPNLILFITAAAPAQVIKPVKWTFSSRLVGQDQVDLIFKAVISSPWHMYGLNIAPGGPIAAKINFEGTKGFAVTGKPTQSPKPAIVYDKIFEMQLELHSGQVTFTQRIKKTQSDSIQIKGNLVKAAMDDATIALRASRRGEKRRRRHSPLAKR